MMKIFGHPMSTCTRKVLMTLEETSTPFDFTLVDFTKGEHKKEPHLGRQPFGQVPALDDDGFALFESRAMCRYINDKSGGALIPADVTARAVMEQWISIETANFTPHVMKFVYHYAFHRPQEASVLEAASKGLEATLAIMDAQLGKGPFLAGAALSLADICFLPYVEYAMATPAKDIFAKFPHVSAWWGRTSERPTWRKTAGRA
jgi:glutathione S-transferase